MTTAPRKRPVRKAVPTEVVIKRDADGNVVIPLDLRKKMTSILELSEKKAEIENELAKLKEDVLIFVETANEPTVEYDSAKFTRVASTKSTIDDDKLKESIGTAKFNKISKRVTDKKLIEAALSSGTLDAKDLADATTVTQNKPYLKVTKS